MRPGLRAFCCAGLFVAGLAQAQESEGDSKPVSGKTLDGGGITESSCGVLATRTGLPTDVYGVDGMHALGLTAEKPLRISQNADMKIKGVVCWRSEARLVANDYLVLQQTGLPLYIKNDTEDEAQSRTIVLEPASGSFRVRQLSGPEWSAAEQDEILQLIKLYAQKNQEKQ